MKRSQFRRAQNYRNIFRFLAIGLLLIVLFATAVTPARAEITAGTFAPKVDLATNMGPVGIEIGDLNGDGKADLAVANYGSLGTIGNTVSVLRNTSTGGSLSFAPKADFGTGNGPHDVIFGDLDGDGKPELVMANYGAFASGTTLSVLRNTSTNGNISFAPKVDLTATGGPVNVIMGDLDGDGKPDLAATNFADGNGSTVSVFRNTSAGGGLSFAPKVDFVTGAGPYGIAIGDVDGDGKRDLATVNFGLISVGDGNTVSILRNTSTSGNISFAAKVDVTTGVGPRSVLLVDFDGDGKLDLATSNFGVGGSGNTVSVLRNTSTSGSVSFAAKIDLVAVKGPLGLASNDLDGNGKPDLAATNYGTNWPQPMNLGNVVSVFGNTSVSGTISFAPKVDFGTGAGPHAVVAGDVTQDNKPELAAVNYGNGDLASVSVLQNTTGGIFNTPTFTATPLYTATFTPSGPMPTDTPTSTETATVTNTSVPATATNTPINTPTFTATTGPTSTPTNTPLPVTATNTPINTPTFTATTGPTSTPTNTPLPTTDLLFDDFAGTSLSTSWYVPWNGAPGISGGIATFNNGNTIQSNGSFGDGNVFEVQAQYSLASYSGLCWTNAGVTNYVCWVPLSSNTSRFAWFTSNGGETDTGISVPAGYHRYAILRNGTSFTVYIDDVAVYSASNSLVSVDRAYLSGYSNYGVDWACVYALGTSCQGAGTSVPTPAPTNTPLPTATYTPTRTPTSTATPTSTFTSTPLPPTPTNTVVPGNTGWVNPSANSGVTGSGDGNGYEVSPTNAYTANGLFAVDNNSGTTTNTSCTSIGKDKHNFYNYSIAVPGGTIDGIEVRLNARADSTFGSPKICVQLSWDGGVTWTSAKSTSTLTTSSAAYVLGAASDNWGRIWTTSNFSNANFRVRVINVSSNNLRDFSLDAVSVRVTYH